MKRGEKGVTLIEVLVALGILSIIGIILYSSFSVALRGWKKSDNVTQAAGIARIVLDRMTREISSAIIKPGNRFYCVGYNGPSGYRSNSKSDEFYFIAPLNPNNSSGSDLCEVGYWVDSQGTSDTSDDSLMRFYVTDSSADFDYNFSTGRSDELATNVTDLSFLYYDSNGAEFKTWDSRTSNKAPSRIKIKIKVEVGEGKTANPDFYSGDFSTTISFPQ